MNKKFIDYKDKNIVIQYIQQIISETYNDKVLVNGEYYTVNDNNYGIPHYIAKYLDYMYPALDSVVAQTYEDAKTNNDIDQSKRSLTQPISISNYYLCGSDSTRLSYDVNSSFESNTTYSKIYSKYMCVGSDGSPMYPDGFNKNDMPLFTYWNPSTGLYDVRNNTIFTLESWQKDKDVCELDDLVCSFLLGRVIGPKSSREDILYVQRLLIKDRTLTEQEKGQWKMGNDPAFDMTQTIIDYQRSVASQSMIPNVFVTGYFDPFTEAHALREYGDDYNGILGL